jgi:two-component system chemotaxis response regulator CheY
VSGSLRGRRALVVDDSAAVRARLRRALQAAGVETREARHGGEAWRALQEARVDVILTDVHMPVMDGLKLIALVRGDEAHRATPVVVITSEAAGEEVRRAEGLGASAWLAKPVDDAELVRVIRSLLAARAGGRR